MEKEQMISPTWTEIWQAPLLTNLQVHISPETFIYWTTILTCTRRSSFAWTRQCTPESSLLTINWFYNFYPQAHLYGSIYGECAKLGDRLRTIWPACTMDESNSSSLPCRRSIQQLQTPFWKAPMPTVRFQLPNTQRIIGKLNWCEFQSVYSIQLRLVQKTHFRTHTGEKRKLPENLYIRAYLIMYFKHSHAKCGFQRFRENWCDR